MHNSLVRLIFITFISHFFNLEHDQILNFDVQGTYVEHIIDYDNSYKTNDSSYLNVPNISTTTLSKYPVLALLYALNNMLATARVFFIPSYCPRQRQATIISARKSVAAMYLQSGPIDVRS